MDKILIVDDNPLQAKVLESILEDEYEVTKCYRAEEGLEIAKSGDFSLILSDIVMPGDGWVCLAAGAAGDGLDEIYSGDPDHEPFRL